MRARDGCTPVESLDLLVTLLRENDNCENSLSDDYYVAQVIVSGSALLVCSPMGAHGRPRLIVLARLAPVVCVVCCLYCCSCGLRRASWWRPHALMSVMSVS